jgi:hypothetical protein
MERPVNKKLRENAILKLALACLVTFMLIGYHLLITRSVYQIEDTNNRSLVAPPKK